MSEVHEDHGAAGPLTLGTSPEAADPLVAAIGADSGTMTVDGRDTTAWEYIALLVRNWAGSAIPGNLPNRGEIAENVGRTVAAGIWPYIMAASSDRAVTLVRDALGRAGIDPASLDWRTQKAGSGKDGNR